MNVAGELWIAEENAANGYLNMPEINAKKICVDPFVEGGLKRRLYRTGDLAKVCNNSLTAKFILFHCVVSNHKQGPEETT